MLQPRLTMAPPKNGGKATYAAMAAKAAAAATKAAIEAKEKKTQQEQKGKGGGKGSNGKGAGKGKELAEKAKKFANAWPCEYAPCHADLKKHTPGRGPFVNPPSATHCKHCQTQKGTASTANAADRQASRSALRAAAATGVGRAKAQHTHTHMCVCVCVWPWPRLAARGRAMACARELGSV